MKATLDCLQCIASQALRAARLASDDAQVQRKILDACVAEIPGMDLNTSPAVLSLMVYETAQRIAGVADPYYQAKQDQNAMALEIEDELRELVRTSADPLSAALHLSAAGNIIDLGTMHLHEIDVRGAIAEVMRRSFAIDHSQDFRESLSRCKDLLFLLDNAGEIVFDKILIEVLLEHTGVTAVVKAGPIINDVLMEDAEQTSLTQLCEVIDNGGAFVGSPLELVPETFLDRMRRADLILGKGQGNYETVDTFPGDVFLMLRAKCEVIAQHMGVQLGEVALISTRRRAKEVA